MTRTSAQSENPNVINRVFRFSGSFMDVELVQVLMSSISSLSIREIRLTTTGK